MRQRPATRRSRLALLDTMGALLPGAVALVSFAPFSGATATLVAAVLTVATHCMVFRDPR
jgi:zinc transporter ZupT